MKGRSEHIRRNLLSQCIEVLANLIGGCIEKTAFETELDEDGAAESEEQSYFGALKTQQLIDCDSYMLYFKGGMNKAILHVMPVTNS